MALYVILLFLFLLAFVIVIRQPKVNGEYILHPFDVKATTALRGLLAFGIVLAHLHIYCFKQYDIEVTKHFVCLSQVGVFFFISGYGLTFSYMRKGNDYLKGFLRHRLSKIVIPLFIATAIYVLVYQYITPPHFATGIWME